MYDFPDTPKALLEVIGPEATLWLSSTEGTVHHIIGTGGSETGILRTDRVTVNTYAPSRDAARAAAEDVHARLAPGPHETTVGLLDYVHVEVPPHDVPFASDTTVQFQAVYRVDTRPI